jgi:hypothetical protein
MEQQEYEPLCSGAVKSILKKTNRVSFSTMDQTKLFFRVDPPADINKVRPSINGSSALGEILGKRESLLHERKVFRLTRAFEPEPHFAGERLIEASFVRDDSDQFSGDEDDPRRTVAVIHFGQDFRNTYHGGASMEPRVVCLLTSLVLMGSSSSSIPCLPSSSRSPSDTRGNDSVPARKTKKKTKKRGNS